MQKNEFLCQFYEIYAGKILNHIADSYENISLSVLLKNEKAFFEIDNSIPVVLDLEKREHMISSGLADISLEKRKMRYSKKKLALSKLMLKYLKNNKLIALDSLGNIEIIS